MMRSYGLAITSVALLLAGCGGGDARQRQAFTAFLQTRILDKPGVHVPQPTEAEKASFGHYADDYAIITGFNTAMDKSISPRLSAAMQAGSITSLEDVVTEQDKLRAAQATIGAMDRAIGGEIARADAAHAAMDQPADVKAVFDKAYDRLVTQPAGAFRSAVPVMDKVLGQAVDLGHYIDEHRAAVRVAGSSIQTSDPAVLSTINQKLQAMQGSQQAVVSAQSRLRSVVYGSGS